MKTTRLRMVLREVEPAVARVIDAPATTTLPELHELLQVAIGWTDSHLHQFVKPEAPMEWNSPESGLYLSRWILPVNTARVAAHHLVVFPISAGRYRRVPLLATLN